MIKAIIYDLDGVLVNACDWHYEALNMALREITGYAIPREDHEKKYDGLPTRVKLNALVAEGLIDAGVKGLVHDLKQEYTFDVIRRKCRVNSRRAVIRRLVDKYKIGCVTNCVRDSAHLMLLRSNILEYFSVVISNEDMTRCKPNPDGYIIAMHELKVKPKETVIVEDNPNGIAAAEASGAKVLVLNNFRDFKKLMEEYL